MKAVLVGAGGMGQGWAHNLIKHNVEVSAWVDIREDFAREQAEKHEIHADYVGTDLVEAIERTNPNFVVDVTIPEAHHGVTLTALSHGLPVIGEKPMASSMAEAREMVAASERAGKLYMVSQSRRYTKRLQAFRNLIKNHLGRLGILNSDFYIGAHFGGFRDEMDHVLLLDMAIHTFDEARYISGADPVSVYCEEFNPSWSWYRGAASANAQFEMTDGLRFTYRGCWCAEGLHSSWDGDWRAVGERGTAIWDHNGVPQGQVVKETGAFHSVMDDLDPVIPEGEEGIGGSLLEFVSALNGGPTPSGECHDNIKSLAMVFAAVQSAKEGRRVPVEI